MNLKKYFDENSGAGALATSNKSGAVDVAVYSTPNVEKKNAISFVMKDRLSLRNLKSNPKAAYMFTVAGTKARGLRLYLTMTGVESDLEKVLSMRKRTKAPKKGDKLFLVHFRVRKARALVGEKEYPLT